MVVLVVCLCVNFDCISCSIACVVHVHTHGYSFLSHVFLCVTEVVVLDDLVDATPGGVSTVGSSVTPLCIYAFGSLQV